MEKKVQLTKIKQHFCLTINTINQVKRQPINWEISQHIQPTKKINKKKTNKSITNISKQYEQATPRRANPLCNKHEKICNLINHQGKCKFSSPSPDLLPYWGCILKSPPEGSDACSSFRTTAPEKLSHISPFPVSTGHCVRIPGTWSVIHSLGRWSDRQTLVYQDSMSLRVKGQCADNQISSKAHICTKRYIQRHMYTNKAFKIV